MREQNVVSDAELDLLLHVVEEDLRRTVAKASLLQNWTDRQLSVLRNTYPAWNIGIEHDERGLLWWAAVLPLTLTTEQLAIGVAPRMRQPDAIALAAALAWQSALLHTPMPPLGR